MAKALFDVYESAGFEVRWLASRVPPDSPKRDGGRIRVSCLNLTERRFGVPWPLWGPSGIRELARLVRWADIVHVHDCLYFGSALAVLLARRAGKSVLLSQHIGFGLYSSAILNGIESLAYRTLGRAVLRRASQLVFCTPAAEEYITTLLGKRNVSATAVPYGIDTGQFHPPTPSERAKARSALGLPETVRVVLFVGRLVEKKGASLFLRVSRLMPGNHFLMVGDGAIRPAPAENLTWIPSVQPQRMALVYQAADAFVVPSSSEGFPLSVLEAMSSGVPVIAPKGEAFSKQLERENCCITVERTPQAICEALNHLLEATALAGAMSGRARELTVRRWSLSAMGKRYVDLISQMMP